MTNQTNNKMTKLVFAALASLMVMTTACSKKGSDAPTPAAVVPTCTQPCVGGVGVTGQFLYGGTATGLYNQLVQAQFQVSGDPTGNGVGSIAGVVNINNYVCQIGMNNLNGPFTIQMTQPGYLIQDVFSGYVNLVGQQGTIPAVIKVIPVRTGNSALFTIWICGGENSLTF
jgi:hypothetical protein